MVVHIYPDGACQGNPGPGGWGVVLEYGHHQKLLHGAELATTNNRMELMAAIQGLTALKRPSQVIVTTDSMYVKQGITEWLPKWQAKNWRTANGKPVKNQDLWEQLVQAAAQHQVQWQWIKGHSGHVQNEQADELARQAIKELG